jgi:hypothetical protein
MLNPYVGNDLQVSGVEEYSLIGGKKEGMKIVHVRNGCGLDLYISLDRGGDLINLTYKGQNVNYLTPNGMVSSRYFDSHGEGWIKSFSAGFLTTCGLENVGTPNTDMGEELCLHGSRSQIPVDHWGFRENEKEIVVSSLLIDEGIFKRKWRVYRDLVISKQGNSFSISDRIVNTCGQEEPLEYLFHINFGYPLLTEKTEVYVASDQVRGRNAHAQEDIGNWQRMEKPQAGYEEKCYYHHMKSKEGTAALFNREAGFGACLAFDASVLDCFTEWKMMGYRDYVLGLEPGNCTPDGRSEMRKEGKLKFVPAGGEVTYQVGVRLLDSYAEFKKII